MDETLSSENLEVFEEYLRAQAGRPSGPLVFVIDAWMGLPEHWAFSRRFLDQMHGVRRVWWDGALYRDEKGKPGRLAPPGAN